MTPTIEGYPADKYLASVPDNGRTLEVKGKARHLRSMDDAVEGWYRDSMGVNFGSEHLSHASQPFDYCASLHSAKEDAPYYLDTVPESTMLIGWRCGCEHPRVDMTIMAEPLGGTSALFAVIAGLVLGYKSIHTYGVYLEPGSIYHDEYVVAAWESWSAVFRPHLTVHAPTWLGEMFNA